MSPFALFGHAASNPSEVTSQCIGFRGTSTTLSTAATHQQIESSPAGRSGISGIRMETFLAYKRSRLLPLRGSQRCSCVAVHQNNSGHRSLIAILDPCSN
ncbi:unnamed protein product [Pleuronectes platessa]|uniref:Uncharacterized protein n=1 Tax=Pleuronectes platessa TaxID=8262 RepID=A0A9N7Z132_PLEPL|nr:unnamed protein product [Pleuronectes platessa]